MSLVDLTGQPERAEQAVVADPPHSTDGFDENDEFRDVVRRKGEMESTYVVSTPSRPFKTTSNQI